MSDSQDFLDNSEVWSPPKRDRAVKKKWTTMQACKLAVLVKPEEQLWNIFHPEYKQYKGNRAVWNKIAKQLDRHPTDCVNKWSSMRSNFKGRYFNSRIKDEVPPADELPEPYCHMGFLMNMLQKREKPNAFMVFAIKWRAQHAPSNWSLQMCLPEARKEWNKMTATERSVQANCNNSRSELNDKNLQPTNFECTNHSAEPDTLSTDDCHFENRSNDNEMETNESSTPFIKIENSSDIEFQSDDASIEEQLIPKQQPNNIDFVVCGVTNEERIEPNITDGDGVPKISMSPADNIKESSSLPVRRTRALTTSWTKTQASKLVSLIQAEERLWNSFHPDYDDFKNNRQVWDKVAEQMERITVDCVNKWSSLRSNFKGRYMVKLQSGSGASTLKDMPEPYCLMGFLMEMIQNKKNVIRGCKPLNEAIDTSSKSEANDEDGLEENSEVLPTNSEIENQSFATTLSSPPSTSRRKRRCFELAKQPQKIKMKKETMLNLAFERLMKPEDEWDKTALALGEHMRNAVNEFPHLADGFRVQLMELSLNVQKSRANARAEAGKTLGLKIIK